MSTVVLTSFTPSAAYKADRNIANEGMALLSTVDGVLEHYHGVTTEDENLGYTIGIATSPEAFKNVVTNPELFETLKKKFEVTRVGDFKQHHAITISDPKKALCGPLTEVCIISLKEPTPENKQTIDKLGKEFNEITEGKWTFGWTGEDSNKAIVIAAWDSIEAHHARGQQADVADRFKQYMGLIDTNGGPAYVKFTQH